MSLEDGRRCERQRAQRHGSMELRLYYWLSSKFMSIGINRRWFSHLQQDLRRPRSSSLWKTAATSFTCSKKSPLLAKTLDGAPAFPRPETSAPPGESCTASSSASSSVSVPITMSAKNSNTGPADSAKRKNSRHEAGKEHATACPQHTDPLSMDTKTLTEVAT
ncbi:hypothetical protein B0O80DRAFT_500099 [Mortierella sp. GBAus27b]|nr:hypothetical protein B0O80DRAFT_500099 [Mortierella sp. GBAus27b]